MFSRQYARRAECKMIFISYSWADAHATHAIHRWLTKSGWDTWIDIERLDLQSDIPTQLENAVNQSSIVLFIDSLDAYASEWTRFELACAEKAQIPVKRICPDCVTVWDRAAPDSNEQDDRLTPDIKCILLESVINERPLFPAK